MGAGQVSTRAKALSVAASFGFVLDELNSGQIGLDFTAIFDHPTHSIGADCRSITVSSYPGPDDAGVFRTASYHTWSEIIERMEAEGPLLTPCTDPECDYHHEGDDQ
jgi:hypothetical protein